jgi:hypothetical protein
LLALTTRTDSSRNYANPTTSKIDPLPLLLARSSTPCPLDCVLHPCPHPPRARTLGARHLSPKPHPNRRSHPFVSQSSSPRRAGSIPVTSPVGPLATSPCVRKLRAPNAIIQGRIRKKSTPASVVPSPSTSSAKSRVEPHDFAIQPTHLPLTHLLLPSACPPPENGNIRKVGSCGCASPHTVTHPPPPSPPHPNAFWLTHLTLAPPL